MDGRHDALRGSAQIILDVDRIARETGAHTVGTVGHLIVRPGAMNVIPGEVELGIDFRDASASLIDSGVRKIRDVVEAICRDQGLQYSIKERAKLTPTPMSKNVMGSIERAARELGASYTMMPSGAAHDTQNMARICDVGMIFVPSKRGISHSPLEWTDPEDLELGANVLLNTTLELSGHT
jgi:N-carbamoyl-L-amino-acid hydrolase